MALERVYLMPQKTISGYRKMVRSKAWRKFLVWAGGWNSFIVVLISILVTIFIKKPKSFQEWGGNEVILTGLVILIVYLWVLLFYLGREPVIIYNSQQNDVDNLKDKWDGARVKASNILIIPEDYKEGETFHALLRIENREDRDLDDCYADLHVVKIKENGGWKVVTPRVIKQTKKLMWPAHGHDKVIIRKYPSSEVVSV